MLSLTKIIFIIYNSILTLTGGTILVVTGNLWWLYLNNGAIVLCNIKYIAIIGMVLITGTLMATTGCIGCFDATRKSGKYLTTYCISCFTMSIILGLTLLWAVHNQPRSIKFELGDKSEIKVINSHNDHAKVTELVDSIQTYFQCCGESGPKDWLSDNFKQKYDPNYITWKQAYPDRHSHFYLQQIPKSCCLNQEIDCMRNFYRHISPVLFTQLYQDGCVDKIGKLIYDNWYWLYIILGSMVGYHLVGLAFGVSIYYCKKIYKNTFISINKVY